MCKCVLEGRGGGSACVLKGGWVGGCEWGRGGGCVGVWVRGCVSGGGWL